MEELDSLGLLATESRPQPRELQYEDLSKLTYLNLVIKVRCCQSAHTHHSAETPDRSVSRMPAQILTPCLQKKTAQSLPWIAVPWRSTMSFSVSL